MFWNLILCLDGDPVVLSVYGPIQTDDLFPSVVNHFWYYYWDNFLPIIVISLFCLFLIWLVVILKHLDWFFIFLILPFLIICLILHFRLYLQLFCPAHCIFYFLQCYLFFFSCFMGAVFSVPFRRMSFIVFVVAEVFWCLLDCFWDLGVYSPPPFKLWYLSCWKLSSNCTHL